MTFDTVFLDLDGTLSDSMPGITNSVSWALSQYGIDVAPKALRMFVGPPLRESFQKYFDFTDGNVDEVIRLFRQRYGEKGVYELTLYPGVPEMLNRLERAGKRLILASSKEEDYVCQILDDTGIARHFSCIAGADLKTSRLSKGEVLRHACREAAVTDMERSIMVGDREHDVHGAHETGMRCAAVLYGYGSREELGAAGADFFISTVAELADWLTH